MWNSTKFVSFASLGLMLASIIVSLFTNQLLPMIAVFAGAVASFVFSTIWRIIREKKADRKADDDIYAMEQSYKQEFNDYEKNHKLKVLDALNKKLQSLGYKPANAKDLSIGTNKRGSEV